MTIPFSTKAGTLEALSDKLAFGLIAPLVRLTVEAWKNKTPETLNQIQRTLGQGPYIVRSSCWVEDQANGNSNAGAFETVLNVVPGKLSAAIDRVTSSYKQDYCNDEVLIQPMLQNVLRSGVAFSHDPNTLSPYRVINWTEGADTTSVTSGQDARMWQGAAQSPVEAPATIKPIIHLIEELLGFFDEHPLDVEFAVTQESNGEQLWLLQCRPLNLTGPPESAEAQKNRISLLHSKIQRGIQPKAHLMGKRTVYGVMPDWNPAEMIGVRPKPLALALYRELITDSTWAYQRHNYGYRNLRSHPLMPHFVGLPYIDVRLSFNSFIPSDLDDQLAGRLVDYYINSLLAEPNLHDKVEFEIVHSCYTLDLPEQLMKLEKFGFSEDDQILLANSLRTITNRIVHPETGLWKKDALKLTTLNVRRKNLINSEADPLEKIYWLLEDCRRYGTLPFAGLARAGFIAVQMARSLVSVGIFSAEELDDFMRSLSTVSGKLAHDRAVMDKTSFLANYGHLRPGTYDILSPRYDEAPDLYFDWSSTPEKSTPSAPFSLNLRQIRDIRALLQKHDLQIDPVALFDFMQAGIELRELAKFQFTRNLSDTLALISEFGAEIGFSKEDLSFANIKTFQELHIAAIDPKEALSRSIEEGRAQYDQTLHTALPPLISHPDQVWSFETPKSEPNFITQKQVTGVVVGHEDKDSLGGAIAFIPNADPGFDWLFSCPIAGLVTAWGGVNSHMAIRAGELGIPAVIGAGELFYNQWRSAKRIHIDCAGRRVEILQ